MAENELWASPSEYAGAATAWTSDAVDSLSRELHPILAEVRREKVADLATSAEHAPETADLASPLYRSIEVSHEMVASVQDTLDGDVGPFLAMVFELADSMGSQQVAGMVAHISEVCEASGQTIDAAGRDFFDALTEMYETIDMSFGEDGKPNLSVMAHPEILEKMRGKKPTPEQEAKIQEVIDRRRTEWHASRSRLDLP